MKKYICVLAAALCIFGMLPFSVFAREIEPAGIQRTYAAGDIIEFGSYPQTRVTESSLISKLNSQPGTWVSYKYFANSTRSDFMKYMDVIYNGEKYRAVRFDSYRPYYCDYSASYGNSFQSINGYSINTTYWFRYEPLKWIILDPQSGYVMCESIIDSQHFYNNYDNYMLNGKKIFPNNWEYSDIRSFLNTAFYNSAFSAEEKMAVEFSLVKNTSPNGSSYPCNDTEDKIFLPSYYDMITPEYGFSGKDSDKDSARAAQGTDYAKCQGLYVETSPEYKGNSYYFLRSAGGSNISAYDIYVEGSVDANSVDNSSKGTRPVMKLDLQSETVPSPLHKYAVGDIIEFGSYPQTRVTESGLISRLNSQSGTWVSYKYYISGSQSDFMQYKDVSYNGEKYRAVKFDSYRPIYCNDASSKESSNQDENGYEPNTTYWFRYEPIKWRVLDPATGYVMCESSIDAQQFYNASGNRTIDGKTVYANNWEKSDIRTFLNETFRNTAFTKDEQAQIKLSDISNESPYSSKYPCNDTEDRIYLPSYYDIINSSYGFSEDVSTFDYARRAQCTDYAKCQGIETDTHNNVYYYLRSAGYSSRDAYRVSNVGAVYDYNNVYSAYVGVRPALKLDLHSEAIHSQLFEKVAKKDATCTEAGNSEYWKCEKCGRYYSDSEGKTEITLDKTVIKKKGHKYSQTVTEPTCTEGGYTTYKCSRCGDEYKGDETAPKGHDFGGWVTDTPATETSEGSRYRICKICKFKETEAIPKLKKITITKTGDLTVRISGYSADCDIIRYAPGAYGTINEIKAKNAASYVNVAGKDSVEITVKEPGYYTFAIRNPVANETRVIPFVIGTPFKDIPETSWYTEPCLWCNAKGYITGTGDDTFSPSGTLTRAQFVQILAKVDGVDLDAVKYTGKFTDVKDGVWYARAVQWAVDCGVTGGTGDKTFSPDNAVSREQLATFFMAYAGYKGYDVSATTSLSKYTDADTTAAWAKEAVTWAIAEGLISGTTDTTISPKKSATRAQAAVIFRNFAENYVAKQVK